ncbi:hypothetical protein [Massilia horti]|uniref:Lipoprotein n=1 Tax=Massilia horti TaxID=2562153 RepID=A0A4Y9SL34_9BURK|nr:hypothetical protein [Massilia horti]TFW27402.1 hypothetical protein E4O92_24195 [Massilia horti]
MRGLTLLLPALLLAACATPQEQAQQKQAEMAQRMVIYGPACSRLGYPTDSDQWRNCILNLSERDDIQRYYYSYPPPGYYGWGPGWRGYGW